MTKSAVDKSEISGTRFAIPTTFAHSELAGKPLVRWQRDDLRDAFTHPANMAGATTFGARLKKARAARGWTQEQLAAEAETSKGYISDLEKGKRPIPPGRTLERLASALQITVDELVSAGREHATVPVVGYVSAAAEPRTRLRLTTRTARPDSPP